MLRDYGGLGEAVVGAGFYSSFHDGWLGEGRMICAARRDERGLTGASYWVAERGGRWYLGMWGGDVFRFEDPAAIIPACVRFLADEGLLGPCLRVPAGARGEYRLAELSESEVNEIFPEGE